MRLAIVLVALLAVAARDGCGNGGNAHDPCAGKVCGEPCRVCPPDDPSCAETADVKACDAAGRCVQQGAVVCDAAACAGKACGADCTIDPPCRSATPPCMAPSVPGRCDAGGACVAGPPAPDLCPPPPPSWGCVGKACGDSCGFCPPDTDPSSCPVPTFAPTACDARLQCVTEGTFTCPPPVERCAGEACGTPCDPCGGTCMAPYASACDPWGACVPATPWLCYDPCAGKACGADCHPCPPDAVGCAAPAVVTSCDAAGRCVPRPPDPVCP